MSVPQRMTCSPYPRVNTPALRRLFEPHFEQIFSEFISGFDYLVDIVICIQAGGGRG